MLIAQEKRKSNIAEYILYMWQVEDLVRAYQFNMDLIEENIISQFSYPETKKQDIRNWYTNIILSMHVEEIKEKGHMKSIKQIMEDLNNLHMRILSLNEDIKYLGYYNQAKQNIIDLRDKLKDKNINDIEVCFDGLYGLLLMRLKGSKINQDTEFAMHSFSNLLAILSSRFKQIEDEKLI